MDDEFIHGLDRLNEKLKEGGVKSARAFLRSVEKEAAQPILEAMHQTVPKDTGALEGALRISSKSDDHSVTVAVGPDKDENYIGRFLEFGTVHMGARHWMSEAFEGSKDEAMEVMKEKLEEAVDELGEGK